MSGHLRGRVSLHGARSAKARTGTDRDKTKEKAVRLSAYPSRLAKRHHVVMMMIDLVGVRIAEWI
jgi:hypothetical protein